MRGLRVAQLLVCSVLFVSAGVWAEASKTVETPAGHPKADAAKEPVTELNLQLPSSLDTADAALTLEDRTQALPDLFAPKAADGRVSVDGSFLVEEDLELNPGAGLDDDNGDRNKDNGDNKEDETSVLDDIEGAQLNIRLKMD